MSGTVTADPSRLAELRAKIDAIDESVHRLLMQRASVIDELIEVKARRRTAPRSGRVGRRTCCAGWPSAMRDICR